MKIIRGVSKDFIPASHEPADDPNVLKKVLAEKDILNSGRVQMINWAKMPPGRSFCEHYHEDMQEIFVIVNGQATADVAGCSFSLSTGDMIIIEPGENHILRNTGGSELNYIVIGISEQKGGRTVVVGG